LHFKHIKCKISIQKHNSVRKLYFKTAQSFIWI